MEHFNFAQWAAYLQDVSPLPDRELMGLHLKRGCEECGRLLALAARIRDSCSQEPQVPENLVNAAKAVFPIRNAQAAPPEWLSMPLLRAKSVFDNLVESAQAGARTASDYMVQAVYHAGDYTIEVQLEHEPESATMAVVGQVVNRADPATDAAGVPVLLMSRNKVVGRGECNRFGEFCLIAPAQAGLKLCLKIEALDMRVEVPLRFTLGDQP